MALNDHIISAGVVDFVSLIADSQEPVFPEVLDEHLLIDCFRGEIDHSVGVLISHDVIGPTLAQALSTKDSHRMLCLANKLSSSRTLLLLNIEIPCSVEVVAISSLSVHLIVV